MQLQTPPENFRTIPILPTVEDIHQSSTFLRPNLVKGQYQDTEHYLDVQYRLLREDYVKPLRDGISEYLLLKKQNKSAKRCRDVKVYLNVNIVKQEYVNGGLVHIANFNDANFAKYKWEYSKRFLTGSLLCLSDDDFQTTLFATVAHRDPNKLVKGLLLLRFDEITDEVMNLSLLRKFVVIETSAYFEAYRHNLHGLLKLDEESLAMKPYIIEVQKNVQKPLYLQDINTSTFDLRPLLLPLDDKYIRHEHGIDGAIRTTYQFPDSVSQKARNIQVLKEDQWPTYSELNLNPSQHTALKAAITKEFAVIQGPPGTGKTYVGLRIAQLLLHNMSKWQSEEDHSPILVVCYTNHALDQFLEGLLLFTQRIVRVGGRGSNESVAKFQLNNLKRLIEEKREVPLHIFKSIRQKHFEIKVQKEQIDMVMETVNKSYSKVMNEIELRGSMSTDHYCSLKNTYSQLYVDDGKIIHDWLGVRDRAVQHYDDLRVYEEQQLDHDMRFANALAVLEMNTNQEGSNDEDSEEEADIEFIEAQRDINPEEFADVNFEMPLIENKPEITPVNEEGWHTQGGKKAQKRYITNCLLHSQAMSETEVQRIANVWNVSIDDRWRLYKYWLEIHIKSKQEEVFYLQQDLKKEYEELCEMRTEEDLHVCQQAHVVGMTTTGAAKYRSIVQHLNPKIVIVEEAAEILESHIVTSLAPNTQHVILIGDHQQLKPNPCVYQLAAKYDLDVSLFERMVKNGMECYRLDIQHRMRPDISALLVPHIYTDLKNHESVTKFESIKGVNKNVFFITHTYTELQESDSKSKVNKHEAAFLVKLCKYILLQGYDPSQITVLTTYTGQLFEIKKLVGKGGVLQGIRFTVVDNYQGEENDIILVSFVRSNEEGQIGFLKVSNRVCVALSRAKKGLFCIGNFELLAEKSNLWKNITTTLHKSQAIGPSLQLMCQNHPDVSSVVACEKDFESVPEGGCTRNCEFRLSCGHVCPKMCHPYDKEHETIKCSKQCAKACEIGHPCKKKCSQECGSCMVKVDKRIISCGHTIQVPCCDRNKTVPCTLKCEKLLSCGHACQNTCSVACTIKCYEKVKLTSKVCGHALEIECCNSGDVRSLIKACKESCKAELSCGHICKGKCSSCLQGRLHDLCKQPCKRILVCGHECRSPCSKSCPPCKRPCENRCHHSKCPKKCGEPCDKCTEKCAWSCEHKNCSCLCGEPCDRTVCDMSCLEVLECGHPCIGICGEPCPKECRICNNEKVTEIFLGSEDEVNAQFICLEDCNHIFELSDITQWMNHDTQENKGEIKMKECPRCKVVIRRNLCFGNIVKSCLADIEKVKKVTYGDSKHNKSVQLALLKEIQCNGQRIAYISQLLERVLSASRARSVQELTVIENIIKLGLGLEDATTSISHSSSYSSRSFTDIQVQELFYNLDSYMRDTRKWLIAFIQDEYLTASEQQLHDLDWEIHRLKLGNQLFGFLTERRFSITINPHLKTVFSCILTYLPFRKTGVKEFLREFKTVQELMGSAVINISNMEKQSILKAMGLSRGHWYQCPNGHVYCITECGGATQVGNCNECGAKIGGSSHSLLSTNRVATAMDGSQHGAWSDAMNMDNYRF